MVAKAQERAARTKKVCIGVVIAVIAYKKLFK
jgi:hypothetical protein